MASVYVMLSLLSLHTLGRKLQATSPVLNQNREPQLRAKGGKGSGKTFKLQLSNTIARYKTIALYEWLLQT